MPWERSPLGWIDAQATSGELEAHSAGVGPGLFSSAPVRGHHGGHKAGSRELSGKYMSWVLVSCFLYACHNYCSTIGEPVELSDSRLRRLLVKVDTDRRRPRDIRRVLVPTTPSS